MKNILKLRTRTDRKQWAQDKIMHQVSIALGYWVDELSTEERDALGVDGINEIADLMKAQADRVAKMFGYEEAWRS